MQKSLRTPALTSHSGHDKFLKQKQFHDLKYPQSVLKSKFFVFVWAFYETGSFECES
jgi:hypothetical protein